MPYLFYNQNFCGSYKKFHFAFRSDDHSYSSTKYESTLDAEDIIEISATDSPPTFYDKATEDEGEFEGIFSSDYVQDEMDTLEVQMIDAAEQDENDSSRLRNIKNNR